jgi:broad specificity phosphatase PhoE
LRLYFVRHGESEANVLRVISNRGRMHGLTDKGRQQALALAGALHGARISAILSSPLLRAAQTAEILAQWLEVGVETSDALREPDCGIAEGRADAEAWQLHHDLWDDWLVRLRWDSRIAGGESFNDVQQRFMPLLDRLLRENQDVSRSLVLIGHGMLYHCLLPLVLTNISRQAVAGLGFPNTGYVLAESGPNGLVCLEWCGAAVAAG